MAKPTSSDMAKTVLSISSQVAFGPVGNSAAVPAMEALGMTVYAVPTTVLSHHPGHAKPAGVQIPAAVLASML
ncbi:MAG TPA: pyridoxal kinase, partial [Aestuariivirgaceae bacterium]|nr:pyridoxal kinase [Aestuariivirgaceae bacterium]